MANSFWNSITCDIFFIFNFNKMPSGPKIKTRYKLSPISPNIFQHNWQKFVSTYIKVYLIITSYLLNYFKKNHHSYSLCFLFRGNLTTTKSGTLAFSPENPLTRKVTKDAIAMVADDNFSILFALLFDSNVLPQPKGYKNAKEMELALTQPNAMNQILVGIQFDDSMASEYLILYSQIRLCVHECLRIGFLYLH